MLEVDLHGLSAEELLEARERLHAEVTAVAAQDPRHIHTELAHLFEALEAALAAEYQARHASEQHHEIAAALGIDESTGEWLAGA